jgi:thiamine biosynthesis lipoprotein
MSRYRFRYSPFREHVCKRVVLVSGVLFLFCSCGRPLQRDTFVISGTYVEVVSSSPRAAAIVYREWKRLDSLFNVYDSDSELSHLNRASGEKVAVSEDLAAVLRLSQEVYTRTQGVFDVSQGALYELWKESMRDKRFPTTVQIAEARQKGGMEAIAIDPLRPLVTIKKSGLKIDLGGIAKGYIVDKAIQALKAEGVESALVNGGGDIYCLGKNGFHPWRVGIRDPRRKGAIKTFYFLHNEAIATSGTYEQFFEHQGVRYSHLVDPRTGYPVKGRLLSVSVEAHLCVLADAYATAFFILGREKTDEFLAAQKVPFTVYMVSEDG